MQRGLPRVGQGSPRGRRLAPQGLGRKKSGAELQAEGNMEGWAPHDGGWPRTGEGVVEKQALGEWAALLDQRGWKVPWTLEGIWTGDWGGLGSPETRRGSRRPPLMPRRQCVGSYLAGVQAPLLLVPASWPQDPQGFLLSLEPPRSADSEEPRSLSNRVRGWDPQGSWWAGIRAAEAWEGRHHPLYLAGLAHPAEFRKNGCQTLPPVSGPPPWPPVDQQPVDLEGCLLLLSLPPCFSAPLQPPPPLPPPPPPPGTLKA